MIEGAGVKLDKQDFVELGVFYLIPFNILAKNPGNWKNVSLVWLSEAWEERQWAALGNVEIPELPGQRVEE